MLGLRLMAKKGLDAYVEKVGSRRISSRDLRKSRYKLSMDVQRIGEVL